jgi:outer membrane protein TolC
MFFFTRPVSIVVVVVAIALVCMFAPASLFAQATSQASSRVSSQTSSPALSAETLTFGQFLRRVLAANPLFESAILEQAVAQAEIQSALGGFDPILSAKYDYKEETGKEKFSYIDAGVEVPLNTLFGPKVSAGFVRGIGPSISSESATPLSGFLDVGVAVPLWQGVRTDRRRTALEKANLRPQIAAAQQQLEINALLRSAAIQYWSWSEALEQLRIAQTVLDVSVQRANFLASRARLGENAGLDSIEALQEVERRRGDMLRSQRSFEQAGIDAAVFLWTGTGADFRRGGGGNDRFAQTLLQARELREQPQAVSSVAPQTFPTLDAAQLATDRTTALRLRPEMQRLELSEQNTTLDLTLAYEAQKPFIETKAQWFYPLGGAGSGSSTGSDLSLNNFKVGLNVAMPLLFRTAGAQVELFNIALDRVNLQRTQAGRLVQADVDNAVSAIGRAQERVSTAEREVYFAVQMEEGERRRFIAGETTLLIVNLRERAAAEARTRLVTARADYLRAFGQYYWATGKIPELVARF